MQDMAWHGKALYDTALQGNTCNCEEKKRKNGKVSSKEMGRTKIDSMRKEKWWMMFFLFF
jgi:hypothetical protein